MKNLEVADIFNKIADILELKGANPFRIRAYQRAAQNIQDLSEDIEEISKREELEKLPGIGKDLALKIKEIIEAGGLNHYEELKSEMPAGLLELLSVPGLGPKTIKLLYENLKIDSIGQLEKMAQGHKLQGLPGLQAKTEENILRGIELIRQRKERMPLGLALPLAEEIINSLKKMAQVKRISPAGSLRRKKETIGDIDILVTSGEPEPVMDLFTRLPYAEKILAHGRTKSSIITREGIQVDLRVVNPDSFGAALCYFTGSKAHNIHIRDMAKSKGLKINEYGVFREKSGRNLAGKEEEDVYKTINLSLIPPELREDRGEIETALEGRLPRLIELGQIKGDLHVHSKWSDGYHSIEELARAAQDRGYEYIAVADHSKSLTVAGGLTEEELLKKIEEIRKLNKKLKNFRILAGAEVDIRSDGSLDYGDDILRRLDIVIAAIHTGFKQSKEILTGRIVKAMQNSLVHIIAHPTGRLMGVRDAYELDMEEILKTARETNTALEINAYPERLDLDDINSRRAKEAGVKLAISTDAHHLVQLNTMSLGVSVARRAWLEKKDVLNTIPLEKLLRK